MEIILIELPLQSGDVNEVIQPMFLSKSDKLEVADIFQRLWDISPISKKECTTSSGLVEPFVKFVILSLRMGIC